MVCIPGQTCEKPKLQFLVTLTTSTFFFPIFKRYGDGASYFNILSALVAQACHIEAKVSRFSREQNVLVYTMLGFVCRL